MDPNKMRIKFVYKKYNYPGIRVVKMFKAKSSALSKMFVKCMGTS